MEKDEYIKKLYEKYEDEFVRTKNYQSIAEKLAKKYSDMEKNFTAEQMKDVEEFEKYLSSLLEIEVKEAFKQGFLAANKIVSDDIKKKK